MAKQPAAPSLKHLTPVLVVDSVEPGVAFWTDRLGFKLENKVQSDDGKLIFGSVKQGAVEVMYQTRKSVAADLPALATEMNGKSIVLFIAVENLDAVERAVKGAPVVKARHKTFYGSEEIYVREPGGHVVGFAQFA